jgi:hypothetical protein
MNEHDMVVLTRSLADLGLEAGDVGAIVHVYEGGRAFEVEFVAGGGTPLAVVTLEAKDVRAVDSSEILHVRRVAA